MAPRRQMDSNLGRCASLVLIAIGLVFCSMVYIFLCMTFKQPTISTTTAFHTDRARPEEGEEEREEECCRGIEHLELWGDAVKWGADFKVQSSKECCAACKEMCNGGEEKCLCDTWVFCGDSLACGPLFGEVRLSNFWLS